MEPGWQELRGRRENSEEAGAWVQERWRFVVGGDSGGGKLQLDTGSILEAKGRQTSDSVALWKTGSCHAKGRPRGED